MGNRSVLCGSALILSLIAVTSALQKPKATPDVLVRAMPELGPGGIPVEVIHIRALNRGWSLMARLAA